MSDLTVENALTEIRQYFHESELGDRPWHAVKFLEERFSRSSLPAAPAAPAPVPEGQADRLRELEEANERMALGLREWCETFQALIPREAKARVDAQIAKAGAAPLPGGADLRAAAWRAVDLLWEARDHLSQDHRAYPGAVAAQEILRDAIAASLSPVPAAEGLREAVKEFLAAHEKYIHSDEGDLGLDAEQVSILEEKVEAMRSALSILSPVPSNTAEGASK